MTKPWSFGAPATVITGPATDNSAGTEWIEARLGIPAVNARVAGAELAAHVMRQLGLGRAAAKETAGGA